MCVKIYLQSQLFLQIRNHVKKCVNINVILVILYHVPVITCHICMSIAFSLFIFNKSIIIESQIGTYA